jgi:hypothetical protein
MIQSVLPLNEAGFAKEDSGFLGKIMKATERNRSE